MPAHPLVRRPADTRSPLRRRMEKAVERLIALMDEMDGDPDLEDGADDEHSLGSLRASCVMTGADQRGWAGGLGGDLEEACEDEGGEHDGREQEFGDTSYVTPHVDDQRLWAASYVNQHGWRVGQTE